MAALKNRQILLKSRPQGRPGRENFEPVEVPVPEPREGQVLLRTRYLSLDPYMRGRMSDARSYAKPAELGKPMVGGTVSEVVASRNAKFAVGDIVVAYAGWQDYALSDGAGLRKIDAKAAPISTGVGVLGMPGMTAYVGLLEIGKPKPGETVVVAAASGAVGSAVGQIAKIKGARAVGVAGGAAKCRFVTEELGFDACIDHRAPDLAAQLAAACPNGVDVDFENVGGDVLVAVMRVLNRGARIPLCGMISEYNATEIPGGPSMRPLLVHRAMIKGFIVSDHYDRFPAFLREVTPLVQSGRIKYREDVVDGLDAAPAALVGLFEGRNFGKMLVRVGR